MTNAFTIPEIRMPTEAQHKATSARWLAQINPCLYENWPEALKALSFRTALVELTDADCEAIWTAMDGKETPGVTALMEKIDRHMAEFDDAPCFVKLSSRSPKDWWPSEGPEPFRSGADVLNTFCGSMRIADELIEYKYTDIPCYLLLREYHPIPKHEEWRCFIRDRKIIGITQYHYRNTFPHMAERQGKIAYKCRRFLESEVIPALHVDTVVVDIWLGSKPVLIEINPFGLSDPCLFTYEELEKANGELRIVEAA